MSLSKSLENRFSLSDRSRGRIYYQMNHVTSVQEIEPGSYVTQVLGSGASYVVGVDLWDKERASRMTCSCPRFKKKRACKHLWATILALEEAHTKGSHSAATTTTDRPQSRPSTTRSTSHRKQGKSRQSTGRREPSWKSLFDATQHTNSHRDKRWSTAIPSAKALHRKDRTAFYIIDVGQTTGPNNESDVLVLSLKQRERTNTGEWGRLKSLFVTPPAIEEFYLEEDRRILQRLVGPISRATSDPNYSVHSRPSEFLVAPTWTDELFGELSQSGRFYWSFGENLPLEDMRPISVDRNGPFTITMRLTEENATSNTTAQLGLARRNERGEEDFIEMEDVVRCASNGIALVSDRLVTVSNPAANVLYDAMRASRSVEIAPKERDAFVSELEKLPFAVAVEFPASWNVQNRLVTPQPELCLRNSKHDHYFLGDVFFHYGEARIGVDDKQRSHFDAESRSWIPRNLEAEAELVKPLRSFAMQQTPYYFYDVQSDLRVHRKKFQSIVATLGDLGWRVVLEGQRIHRAGKFSVSVSSGEDWFDLNASVDFDGESVSLPSLLTALRSKQTFITLADGSKGHLPPELLDKYARYAEFGEVHDDAIRFKPTQAMLLDAMLQTQEHVDVDRQFRQYRKKLQSFSGIKPKNPPRGFCGDLRGYQRDGLGWLHFLREFQIGGCLADDMGLGKTVQVLALLESRRIRRLPKSATGNRRSKDDIRQAVKKPTRKVSKNSDTLPTSSEPRDRSVLIEAAGRSLRAPSIVVVPKSLVFNWIEEAARFTPRLRVVNYTGTNRKARLAETDGFDVLITTYGTMRKDIAELSTIQYDYAILDESQAIKNATAQAAKASRLLKADHRLAMTGTPIENHLGELWSLFEFLNPGMLGRSKSFAALTNSKRAATEDRSDTLEALAQGLRPFLLRRTKDQVLKDLPEKVEQTLHCEMLPAQRKQYDELREYYRIKLAKKIETDGIKKSKIQVLEALLRLRQVACDPRLIDPMAKPGAKVEMLKQYLDEIISEGHKVLVFSQFTSLLGLVRQQLDAAKIGYEYLDGKTARRGDRVKRFQGSDEVPVFLISLKAGGHGLNLTSADYVFLLDPWWNPAVEAQAIDRAHRMGQKRSVTAYRMICQNTVEDKIVALQESKRELASSVITADESLIRKLTPDDLSVLFS